MTQPIQEMQLRPKRGEILFYLSLHEIENMTPLEAIKLCEELGFTPELRYRTWLQDGAPQFGLYALLHYEKRDYNSFLEDNYITDQAFETLAQRIIPNIAVCFTYCLKQGRLEAVA